MVLHPTHMARTPYLFHFQGQTVAMGEPRFLYEINELLLKAKQATRPTFWDQAYLVDAAQDNPDLEVAGVEGFAGFAAPDDYNLLNSVGCDLDREDFWTAVERGVFATAQWPVGNAPLFMPETPQWLANARAWEFDPILPPDGPGSMGGWARVAGREGAGQPVGLFQLTDPDSFWVLGSADDLDEVMNLCRELGRIRSGFDQATGYLDDSARYSCLALPLSCRHALEEELFLVGVDVESLFWE